MTERVFTPTGVVDDVYGAIERHELSNIQALSVFATIILHIVEAAADGKADEMLEEALEMIREFVAHHLTH